LPKQEKKRKTLTKRPRTPPRRWGDSKLFELFVASLCLYSLVWGEPSRKRVLPFVAALSKGSFCLSLAFWRARRAKSFFLKTVRACPFASVPRQSAAVAPAALPFFPFCASNYLCRVARDSISFCPLSLVPLRAREPSAPPISSYHPPARQCRPLLTRPGPTQPPTRKEPMWIQ
jgi:hypothetical protein